MQLTRNVQFFGRDAQQDICNTFVVIVGLGVRLKAPRPAALSLRRQENDDQNR